MFRRILVPCDDATFKLRALRVARDLASHMHAEIVLLRAVPPYTASPQILAEAETALAHRASYLRSQGIHTECVVVVGHREAEIESIARARQVDLILDVPTSSRHLELEWYSRAATHARTEMPAPMLVWPESNVDTTMLDAEDATIIVPVDGSATAERALPYAIRLAESYGRPILLVRVVPSQPPHRQTRERVTERHKFDEAEAEATQYLTTLRSKLAQATSVPVLIQLSVGNPGDEIRRLVERQKAGAIVVCAHSHIRRDRFFLGCVATQILRQAKIPVLIVPQHSVVDVALPTIPASIVVTGETPTIQQ